jgi:PAS domain S-box-containing protein
MSIPLHVLIVEDRAVDAEIVVRELRRAGFEPDWERVDTEPAFLARLHNGLDLVLSDYDMPQFSGLRALELLRKSELDVPLIIVSGTIGEETAVAAMKQGAADYLLKDRLARLGAAVNHAITEKSLRRERKEAEISLRLFRALMDRTQECIEVIDPASAMILDMNEAACRHHGYSRQEYLQLTVFDVDPGLDRGQFHLLLKHLSEAGALVVERMHRRKDGTEFPVELSLNRVNLDRDYVVAIARDITERRRSELALRESDARFRELAENIQEVFWITDPAKNQMVYISPAYEKIWGRTCQSLYESPRIWLDAIRTEDRERVLQAILAKQLAGTYDVEYRIVRPDGSERWIRDRAFPVKDVEGRVRRIVGVAEDITQRKGLEEQFLHAQRMEAIGTLASGVAHDLNNILSPILMVTEILKIRPDIPTKELELLSMIERSSKRGAGIIRQLLTFSRSIPGERGLVQFKHLVRDIVEIMRETFPRNITIVETVAPDLRPVHADPTQLHQVIMNLCVNARDAMTEGGTLMVKAMNLLPEESGRRAGDPEIGSGPYVLLRVQDTGSGIPPEIIHRIFDPFFTTKGVGKGTGLGLSTVAGIIKGHGGVVKVESQPGRGTTFNVYLPVSEDRESALSPNADLQAVAGRNELILVVDDEVSIREATRSFLESQGFRVQVAASGEDAVKLFLEHQETLRLVVTDIMMPGMDGLVLIRTLRRLRSSLPIIATSGLDQSQNKKEYELLRVGEILTKPFAPALLIKAINTALAKSSPT